LLFLDPPSGVGSYVARFVDSIACPAMVRLRTYKPAANQLLHSTHSLGQSQRRSDFAILGSSILQLTALQPQHGGRAFFIKPRFS
jgi:hypothetical protein